MRGLTEELPGIVVGDKTTIVSMEAGTCAGTGKEHDIDIDMHTSTDASKHFANGTESKASLPSSSQLVTPAIQPKLRVSGSGKVYGYDAATGRYDLLKPSKSSDNSKSKSTSFSHPGSRNASLPGSVSGRREGESGDPRSKSVTGGSDQCLTLAQAQSFGLES